VLLKWLGEREADVPGALVGAAAISVPFNLTPCAQALDRGFCRLVYTANFLGTMRAKIRLKASATRGCERSSTWRSRFGRGPSPSMTAR